MSYINTVGDVMQLRAGSYCLRLLRCDCDAVCLCSETLMEELRGVAVPLCDAFAIPDHILRAPIGLAAGSTDPYAQYLAAIGW